MVYYQFPRWIDFAKLLGNCQVGKLFTWEAAMQPQTRAYTYGRLTGLSRTLRQHKNSLCCLERDSNSYLGQADLPTELPYIFS